MKKKIKIQKDENGITWRSEYTKSADGSKSIVSTKIAGFRRHITIANTMVLESVN